MQGKKHNSKYHQLHLSNAILGTKIIVLYVKIALIAKRLSKERHQIHPIREANAFDGTIAKKSEQNDTDEIATNDLDEITNESAKRMQSQDTNKQLKTATKLTQNDNEEKEMASQHNPNQKLVTVVGEITHLQNDQTQNITHNQPNIQNQMSNEGYKVTKMLTMVLGLYMLSIFPLAIFHTLASSNDNPPPDPGIVIHLDVYYKQLV